MRFRYDDGHKNGKWIAEVGEYIGMKKRIGFDYCSSANPPLANSQLPHHIVVKHNFPKGKIMTVIQMCYEHLSKILLSSVGKEETHKVLQPDLIYK